MLEDFHRLVGAEIRNWAYSSTSLLLDQPLQRAQAKEGILAEIHLLAGLSAAYLELVRDRKECELLLPRGMRIRVTRTSEIAGLKRITAEVIS